ncbi:MAG: TonB-dependent receptor, partial [Myxococcales bacterium]
MRADTALAPVTAEGRAEERPDGTTRDPSAFATRVEHRRSGAVSTADLARAAPGVTVRDFGLNQSATVSVRGSTSDQVVVLLDGLPMNSAAGGGTDLSLLPVAFVERLTVLRGASGARYGAGAMGGVVEIDTVDAAALPPLFGTLSYGSFGTADASVGTAHRFGDATAVLFGFVRSSSGDFPFLYDDRPQLPGNPLTWRLRENNDARRAGALLKAGWQKDGTRADLMVEADGGERGLPGSAQAPTQRTRQRDGRVSAVARASRLIGPGELEVRGGGRYGELGLAFEGRPVPPQADARGFGELAWRTLWGRHALEAGVNVGLERLASAWHGAQQRPILGAWVLDGV